MAKLVIPGGRRALPTPLTAAEKAALASTAGVAVVSTGAFTPELEGSVTPGNVVYAANEGSYTKIGDLVFVTGRFVWSDLGGLTGALLLTGLPFNSASGVLNRAVMHATVVSGVTYEVDSSNISGYTDTGTDTVRIVFDKGTFSPVREDDLAAGGSFFFSLTYRAAGV